MPTTCLLWKESRNGKFGQCQTLGEVAVEVGVVVELLGEMGLDSEVEVVYEGPGVQQQVQPPDDVDPLPHVVSYGSVDDDGNYIGPVVYVPFVDSVYFPGGPE